jgi:hypothetical protein
MFVLNATNFLLLEACPRGTTWDACLQETSDMITLPGISDDPLHPEIIETMAPHHPHPLDVATMTITGDLRLHLTETVMHLHLLNTEDGILLQMYHIVDMADPRPAGTMIAMTDAL